MRDRTNLWLIFVVVIAVAAALLEWAMRPSLLRRSYKLDKNQCKLLHFPPPFKMF
jgi:CDP-diacylglycerol pyrophosphatase